MFDKCKEARGVANPNIGFIVQLLMFYKRLYESFDKIPSPRVFCVSTHQIEEPKFIVSRFVKIIKNSNIILQ